MKQQINIVTYDKLSPVLIQDIVEFRRTTSNIYGRKRSIQEENKRKDKYCSDGDIKKWVLVFKDTEIIAVTAVFTRHIELNNKDILLGGLGKVRVKDSMRRLGIATQMMNIAMSELNKLECDVAYLCADLDSFVAKFYQKYGFVPLNKLYSFIGKSGRKYTENDGMIAPIKSLDIYNQILKDPTTFYIGMGNW